VALWMVTRHIVQEQIPKHLVGVVDTLVLHLAMATGRYGFWHPASGSNSSRAAQQLKLSKVIGRHTHVDSYVQLPACVLSIAGLSWFMDVSYIDHGDSNPRLQTTTHPQLVTLRCAHTKVRCAAAFG